MTEPCSCPVAGYCQRHLMQKDEHLLSLCRARQDYRELWDRQAKSDAKAGQPPPASPLDDFGPGTELAELLKSLGISELPGCGCKKKNRQMNRWGVEGCREHFDEIVAWMNEGYDKAKKMDRIKAAALAVASGVAFKLNPLDPFPSLVREAIRRAEEKTTGESCPA